MSSSPPPDSSSSPPPADSPPPPSSSPPPSSPPPPDKSSPPPPDESSPPPPDKSSPPPPVESSPPPPDKSSPPPPVESSPPPPDKSSPPPPDKSSVPPPSNKSPPPSNGDDNSPPPPPPLLPPPPPHHGKGGRLAPPHSNWSPPPPTPAPSSTTNNEKVIIAGAAIGAVFFFLVLMIILLYCCRRKKRRHPNQMSYYHDSPGGNNFYMPPQMNWQNNGFSGVNGQMNLQQPPPPPSSGVSSEMGWMVAPPPPPPLMSSDMSSAGFSGPYNAAPPPHPSVALGFNQSSFTYNDLASATGGFAQQNLIGQGGFGYVHKGVLPNGKEIAVKSLKANSGQGEREFQAEVDIISRVHHRHLVSLVGYCTAGNQRMLVYEFVPNKTLEYHLHGDGRPPMDWPTRVKIALGSAKGFAYLHEDCHPRIIHRDIKAANILIDNNFEAKVADFGLAKLSLDTNTHVSTRIMGTFGYLAPEYASSGKLTEKSDVYSFGIVLLELITGRRPLDLTTTDDEDTLVDWARPILMKVAEGGSYDQLVDPRLGKSFDPQEMHRMVACAAGCVRQSARRRPKMSQIVRALEGDVSLDDLHEGVRQNSIVSSGSSECDMQTYRKPKMMSKQDFNSSEYGLASDYSNSSCSNSEDMSRPGPGNHPNP